MSITIDQALERARGAYDCMASGELARLRESMEMNGAPDAAIEAEVTHWRTILAERRDAQLAELRAFIIREGNTLQ